MTDNRSWRPIYNAMCPQPGARDLFLVILINGKRVAIQQAADHTKWKFAAERLALEHHCQVKVLPMAGDEMMAFLGIAPAPPQPMQNLEPAFREQAVNNCMEALRTCAEPRDRELALELLQTLGALQ